VTPSWRAGARPCARLRRATPIDWAIHNGATDEALLALLRTRT
jgi:hypothetical protein